MYPYHKCMSEPANEKKHCKMKSCPRAPGE
jgi:hypothetical protein